MDVALSDPFLHRNRPRRATGFETAAFAPVYSRLVEAGIEVAKPPCNMRDSYGFSFTALGEVMFEAESQGS